MRIKSFTGLEAWKQGHSLVLMIYRATDSFPKKEIYSLISQMQRAVLSITSNISEGFSRQTKKDKRHFYFMAKGSLTELQNQLLVARDLAYIDNQIFQEIAQQTVSVHKLINGLIKSSPEKAPYQIQNTKY